MDYHKIQFLTAPSPYEALENRYLEVRRREGRVLEDEVVKTLPAISKSSPYKKEWEWRARTFTRLKYYLSVKFKGPVRVLDLGCGNGWMSNLLAEQPHWSVTAVDLNQLELAQGARLFGRSNLQFFYADLVQGNSGADLPFSGAFDVIILAASVQYFPDLAQLIGALRSMLKPAGEIHLVDSHFYKNETARNAARRRSLDYYTMLGVPDMAPFYHHHLLHDIKQLGGAPLNRGLSVWLLQKAGWLPPFPWIMLLK